MKFKVAKKLILGRKRRERGVGGGVDSPLLRYPRAALLIGVIGIVTAACGSTVSSNPVVVSSSSAAQFSTKASMIEVSPSTLWLTTKVGPYWNLVSYDVASRNFAFLTPPSISQRGGFSIAANGVGGGLVAFYPYGAMLYSPYFYTSGAPVNWKTGQLPDGLLPLKHAVVDTGTDIVAAVRNRAGKEEILYGPLGGSKTTAATYPFGGFQIAGLYANGAAVTVDLVRGDHHTLDLFNVTSDTWKTLASVVTPRLELSQGFTGTAATPGSLTTIECALSPNNSHRVTLRKLSSTGQVQSVAATVAGSVSSCGVASSSENYVTLNEGHRAVSVAFSQGTPPVQAKLASTYLAPRATADVDGTLIAYNLTSAGSLLLYRDGSRQSVATPINTYLRRVLKQAQSGGVG